MKAEIDKLGYLIIQPEMNIQTMVNDLLYRLEQEGIKAKATYCLSDNKIVSFEITIVGYYN